MLPRPRGRTAIVWIGRGFAFLFLACSAPLVLRAQQAPASENGQPRRAPPQAQRHVPALRRQIDSGARALPMTQTRAASPAETALNWQSQAKLHKRLTKTTGTLLLSTDGIEFRPSKGPRLRWPFFEIKTFDLLNPRRLVLTGYQNRSWHRHGERKYRFDLATPMPPTVSTELAIRVGKPVRNGDPNPTMPSFAVIPARHPTLWGGTNGRLRFGADGIEYVTTAGEGGRSWRWSDIDTLANPDPYHFTITGYRETFYFQLKEPMSRAIFDRLWDRLYARDFKSAAPAGRGQKP